MPITHEDHHNEPLIDYKSIDFPTLNTLKMQFGTNLKINSK